MNSPEPVVSLERLRAVIAADMSEVDAVIHARLASEVVLINQVARYIVDSGGKRLRPALVVLTGNLTGGKPSEIHELAAIVEFIHTATLLHDDVVDESSLRRGRKTANATFGNAASVLVGDFLYSRAFQMMVAVGNQRVMEVLADATNLIAEGEVLQLLNIHDPQTDEASYLRVVRYKTAKLFQAACQLGAILGGASPANEAALAGYGTHLGTAFQLIDDVLDYSGDQHQTGKNIGDDLAEGKPTLPLIHAMREGNPSQRDAVRRGIESGGREDLGLVLEAIKATGALDYTREAARAEANAASALLANLPDTIHRAALLELCVFAVERRY